MILALLPLNEPSPWGFMNLYAEGDIWQKIKGCDQCPPENNCCGNCPLSSEAGCYLHLVNKGQDKPFHCVVQPSPLKHRANCVLEYKCIQGKYQGLIRRQNEPRNILIDEETGEKITI
jgi:hypothetical protein